jgi:DNA repair exonuclease SbcCD ATPase subunit/predicted MPP superfamily phosphohydrolase
MGIINLPTDKRFTHIIQVADIHIRLTRRHEEYRQAFSKLFRDVSNTPEATAVFILGDLVNSKLDLSPECVDLASEFLRGLADLRPTILVTGNHDTNLSNRNRMDSLSPVVDALEHSNLSYLKETGLYGFGNICINNFSIFDDPEKYIKGSDIPSLYRNKYEYFIATYHGTIDGAETDMGFKLTNPMVRISTFDNHDVALLGDIHKIQDLQQYESGNPIIHYCGSMIQQKHDESLTGHGYSFWNLADRSYTHIEIPNDYGFFTVLVENGIITNSLTNLPKKTRIRIRKSNTTESQIKKIVAEIGQLTDIIDLVVEKEKGDLVIASIPTTNGNMVLGNIDNKIYQNQIISEYLKGPLNVTDQSFIDEVLKVNDEMNNRIKTDDFAKNIRWIPIKFEWENMFSYGKGNVIDFTKVKDLIGIFAPNRAGKSSIFSAMTFCLFDKCERDYKASNVMHTSESNFNCKFEFEVDGKRYFIKRNAVKDKTQKVKVDVRFWKIENGQEIDLNGEQRKDTNEIIREYLGTYEDFVLTTLNVQNGKNNVSILDMGDSDRKDLFAQFMGLNIFDRLHSSANEYLKELIFRIKRFRNEDYNQKLITVTNLLGQAEGLSSAEKNNVEQIEKHIRLIQENILEKTQKLIKLDVEIPSITVSKENLEKAEILLENAHNKVNSEEKRLTETNENLKTIENSIKEFEEKKVIQLYDELGKLTFKQREIQTKREQLKENYVQNNKIFEKAKSLEYDKNCEFCVKNAGKVAQDAKEAGEKLKQIQQQASEVKSELGTVDIRVEEIKWVQESYAKFTSLMKKRNDLKDLTIYISSQIVSFRDKVVKLNELKKLSETNIELYNQNIEAMKINNQINTDITKLTQDLRNLEHTYKTKNQSIIDIGGKILICQNQISQLNEKMEEIKSTEREYKIYEAYCMAVSRDGIPYNIITATMPEIQTEVNNILSQLTDFTTLFEMNGKSIIPYIVHNGKQWLMSMTSGFEKFALSLAIRVALINISNLPRSNFLILDEGFGVFDAENLASLSSLFDYLKTNFEFIMIVSHLDSLRDFVDNHIEITEDNGYSKVNFM